MKEGFIWKASHFVWLCYSSSELLSTRLTLACWNKSGEWPPKMSRAGVHDVWGPKRTVCFHLEKSEETSVCCLQLPDGSLWRIWNWIYFFLKVHCVWMRDNRHMWKHGKFLLGVKESFFQQEGGSNTGTSCSEGLWNIHLRRW